MRTTRAAEPAPAWRSEWQSQTFVTRGQNVYAIASSGQVSLFSTLPCTDDQNGITFDTEGAWGYQLIVECIDGHVYTLDTRAHLTLHAWGIGGIGEMAERRVEDLIAIQGIERRTVGCDFDLELHWLGTAGADGFISRLRLGTACATSRPP